jgi:hypothetical protein
MFMARCDPASPRAGSSRRCAEYPWWYLSYFYTERGKAGNAKYTKDLSRLRQAGDAADAPAIPA